MTQRIENTKEVLGVERDTAFSILLIKAVTQVEKANKKKVDKLMKAWQDGGWNIVFTIEGVEVNLKKILDEWEGQLTTLIDERAVELIQKRVGDAMENVEDVLEEASCAIKKKLQEKAGIKIGEED